MSKIPILIFSIFIILFNQIFRLSANEDTYINSSNITYNENENIVELAENSKINYKNTNILIDKGIIDYNKDTFEVFGNFYLYEELTILSGQDLKGNTSLDIFSANNVSYIYNDDLKIDSDSLDKDENLIYFYNNFLTPCELEGFFNCPTWSLRIDKTEYDIEQDKFTHFDTFLQIADYKVFYLPYFTHYGAKAPRKKGFLTPTIEFTVGGDQGIIVPYYFPLNQSTDIEFRPKIFLDSNFEFLKKYQLNTIIENKSSGGNTKIKIDTIKNEDNNNINTTFKLETKQIISKNEIVSASGLFTNSISTTRSINEEPITFENIYVRLEKYDFYIKDDYFKTEISSVETFDSTDLNSIPISPNINYQNFVSLKNYLFFNELDFTVAKRNESTSENPSEGFKLKINSELSNNHTNRNIHLQNKFIWNNSLNEYYFNNDQDSNHQSLKSMMFFSSDVNHKRFGIVTPRVKFILPVQLTNSNKKINEDSQAMTFNYQNQFSESRFFGNDLSDTSPRIVYALENEMKIKNYYFNLNINQSYESRSNSTYSSKLNQNSKFSDLSLEAKLRSDNFQFEINSRIDQKSNSKKEMNYYFNLNNPVNIHLNYNETKSEAYINQSNDTKSINIDFNKRINDNVNFAYISNLDVKNNYDPYKSTLKISLFDECSQLDIDYSNIRFNDNFNTKPEEIISITFSMDYLGFFGYEQSTDLFFSEPGNLNYGL